MVTQSVWISNRGARRMSVGWFLSLSQLSPGFAFLPHTCSRADVHGGMAYLFVNRTRGVGRGTGTGLSIALRHKHACTTPSCTTPIPMPRQRRHCWCAANPSSGSMSLQNAAGSLVAWARGREEHSALLEKLDKSLPWWRRIWIGADYHSGCCRPRTRTAAMWQSSEASEFLTSTEHTFSYWHQSRLLLAPGLKIASVPGPTARGRAGGVGTFSLGWSHQPELKVRSFISSVWWLQPGLDSSVPVGGSNRD